MVAFRIYFTAEISYLYLVWNLFLAWVPFVLSILIISIYYTYRNRNSRNVGITLLGVLWLFFYPNAPYIITDYIHIRGINFYLFQGGRFIGFNEDLLVWFDFVMNSLFIFTGFLLGFASLYIMQKVISSRFSSAISWGFVTATLVLSSFGIYLGRFIRWNSWDVIANPNALLRSVLDSLHKQAFSFTLLFSVFLLLIYIALYTLTNLNSIKTMNTGEKKV